MNKGVPVSILVPGDPAKPDPIKNNSFTQIHQVRVYVVFDRPEQIELFERLLKRITRGDLKELLFGEAEVNPLLDAVGTVRASIKQVRELRQDRNTDDQQRARHETVDVGATNAR